MTALKTAIRRRGIEKFMDLAGEHNQDELVKTLEQAEKLMKELKYVVKYVVPCYPPSYQIFDLYFNTFKKIILDKIEPYLEKMETILTDDPEIILIFNTFV